MLKIELECIYCRTKHTTMRLPVSLGDWLIHLGKDVFCSLECVTAYTEDLRVQMAAEANEEGRRIVWSQGTPKDDVTKREDSTTTKGDAG